MKNWCYILGYLPSSLLYTQRCQRLNSNKNIIHYFSIIYSIILFFLKIIKKYVYPAVINIFFYYMKFYILISLLKIQCFFFLMFIKVCKVFFSTLLCRNFACNNLVLLFQSCPWVFFSSLLAYVNFISFYLSRSFYDSGMYYKREIMKGLK